MYTELNLCSVVGTLLDGLSDEDLANCLSHVFLTGIFIYIIFFGVYIFPNISRGKL